MEKEYPDVRDLSTLLPIEAAFVKTLAKAKHVYGSSIDKYGPIDGHINDILCALREAIEEVHAENNVPVSYRRISGVGPIYAIHGTSSIAYADALERELANEKEQYRICAAEVIKKVNAVDLDFYKKTIAEFVVNTWGIQALDNRPERAARVLEEALELAQAEGVSIEVTQNIVRRVYSREISKPEDEAGDVFFTLLAWSWTAKADLRDILDGRLNRVRGIPREQLRKRHEDKRRDGTILYEE